MASSSMMGMDVLTALAKERQRLGLSQTAVAERMGLERSNFTRLEGGQSSPTFSTLMRWASALGMTVCVVRNTEYPKEQIMNKVPQ